MPEDTVIERMVAEFGADATEMLEVFADIDRASGKSEDNVAKATRQAERDVKKMAKAIAAAIKKSSAESQKASDAASKAAINAAEKAADAAARSAKAIEDKLNANALLLAGLAAAALAKVVEIGQKVIEEAGAFDEMSRRISVTTEQLSTLEFAVKQFGFSLGELEGILAGTQDTFSVTGEDAEKLDKTLSGIGIKLEDIKDKTPDQQLLDFADAFSKATDETEKIKAATAIYGVELGQRLIPLLEKGRAGIEEIQDEARAFGVEVSSEFARDAKQFQTNMDRLSSLSEGFARTLATDAVPAVNDILSTFLEGARAGNKFEGAVNALSVAWEKWTSVVVSQKGSEETLANLEDIRREIEVIEHVIASQQEPGFLGKLLGVKVDKAALRKQLDVLLDQQKDFQKSLDIELGKEGEAARKKRADEDLAFQKQVNARKLAAAERAAAQEISSVEAQLKSLRGLSSAEELREKIQEGAFKGASERTQKRLEFLAEELQRVDDLKKANEEARKEEEKARIAAEKAAIEKERSREFAEGEVENLRIQIQLAQARTEIERVRITLSSDRFSALTEEQKLELETLTIKLSGLQAEKAAREELQSFAKTVIQENLTLKEQEVQAVERLNEAFAAGFLTQEQLRESLDKTGAKFAELAKNAEDTATKVGFSGSAAAKQLGSDFKKLLFDPTEEGFRSMASNFVESLREMVAEALKSKLLQGLFGGGGKKGDGGGGGIGSILGLADGGPVSGPGTTTSDSILARLSDKEFVVRAKAVDHYGPGLFEGLNRMMLPKLSVPSVQVTYPKVPRFADGGMVAAPPEGTAGETNLDLAVVNMNSRAEVEAFIASRAGRTTILNSLGSDGGHELRKIVGG